MTKASADVFNRTLEQKTQEAKDAVNACIRSFFAANTGQRRQASAKAVEAMERLLLMLHEQDRPDWGRQVIRLLNSMNAHPDNDAGVEAGIQLVQNYLPTLLRHKWRFDEDRSADGVDFDAIFKMA